MTSLRARKVAVLADVHGNAVALEAVLADVAAEDVDLVMFGGDLTWGPLPHETLELAAALPRTWFIRGNAERRLLEQAAGTTSAGTERDRWMLAAHTPADIGHLADFTPSATVVIDGLGPVRFCHGSPRSDVECVTPVTPPGRMSALSEGVAERVLVTAHTHVQFDREIDGLRSINPGSIGLPYEDSPGARWAILSHVVDLRCTIYDADLAASRYGASEDPLRDAMIAQLRHPTPRATAIEDAERREFAG
jgi:predicted phosphodiesterase